MNTIHNKIDKNEEKETSVILIGMNISNQLRKKANRKEIKIKIIGKEIPDLIKICKRCRKAYDSKYLLCSFCDSKKILEIITLKYP